MNKKLLLSIICSLALATSLFAAKNNLGNVLLTLPPDQIDQIISSTAKNQSSDPTLSFDQLSQIINDNVLKNI